MKTFLAILSLLPFSLCAQTISKADILATEKHRDALIQQLQTEHDAALVSQTDTAKQLLAEQQAHAQVSQALFANQDVVSDLNGQISTLDKDIASLKWQVVKERWKFTFVGAVTGIVAAIFFFILAKVGILGASVAAKLGIKAAIA